jgi:uncharacterized protein YkwD
MKSILFITMCLYSLNTYAQIGLHEWNENHYAQYNSNSFQRIGIIHQVADIENIDYELFNAALFYATNIQRLKFGKPRYIHSSNLEKAAKSHSKDMVIYDFFSHQSVVPGKRTVTDRVSKYGINGAAENISINYGDSLSYWEFAQKIIKQWMNSSGHKRNILGDYTYLGCGAHKMNKDHILYFKSTQVFSKRSGYGNSVRSSQNQNKSINRSRAPSSNTIKPKYNNTTHNIPRSNQVYVYKNSNKGGEVKGWNKHHAFSSKPASHFGFDLGLEGNLYKQKLRDVNQVLNDSEGYVMGNGGYLGFSFHPLFLEGLTFGLNGIFGFGESYIDQFSNYILEDTSYSINYKYVKGGFGFEFGTMISRNKGPIKLLCFWNRDYFLNNFSASLSSLSGFYGDFYSPEHLLHEKLGLAIRFGRYSPKYKNRVRGINWDFKFSLNDISENELFDFRKGYLTSILDWNVGFALECWIHRVLKFHFGITTKSSMPMLMSDFKSVDINNVRLGLSYSFDSFH